MSIDILILILVIFFNLLLSFLVLRSGKHKINYTFSSLIFLVVIWSASNYFAEIITNRTVVYILVGLTYAAALSIAILFLRFCIIFPNEGGGMPKKEERFIYLSSLLLIFLSFTRLIIKDVVIESPRNSVISGNFMPLYIVYFCSLMIIAFWILYRKYRKALDVERSQIQYVFAGAFLAVIGSSVTNLIIPFITDNWVLSRYGPYFTVFLIGSTAYAILKHHLFDIKVIAAEVFTVIQVSILFINIFNYENTGQLVSNVIVFLLSTVFGILLINSVIQEVKMRTQLEIANDELRRVDRSKTEFISMASHQLRTPLTSIKGYVSMMLEGSYGKIKAKQEEKLENVFESTQRLIKLINDLLNISKIELGKVTLDKRPTHIEELIKSCYEELKMAAEKKGLNFHVDFPKEPLPEIEIDGFHIRQAILNIIDNAIKYTKAGEVAVSLKRGEKSVLVSVKDTGEGLSDDEKKRIFTSFVRGAAGINLDVEGTGLGLDIAKRLVVLHGGKVWAESEGKGKGSTFFIELPVES